MISFGGKDYAGQTQKSNGKSCEYQLFLHRLLKRQNATVNSLQRNLHKLEREKSFEEARTAVKSQMERIFQQKSNLDSKGNNGNRGIVVGAPVLPIPEVQRAMQDYRRQQATLTRRSSSGTPSRNLSSLSTRHRSMDSLQSRPPDETVAKRSSGTLVRRRRMQEQPSESQLRRSTSHNSLAARQGLPKMDHFQGPSPTRRPQPSLAPPAMQLTSSPPPPLGPMSLFESYPFMAPHQGYMYPNHPSTQGKKTFSNYPLDYSEELVCQGDN